MVDVAAEYANMEGKGLSVVETFSRQKTLQRLSLRFRSTADLRWVHPLDVLYKKEKGVRTYVIRSIKGAKSATWQSSFHHKFLSHLTVLGFYDVTNLNDSKAALPFGN